MWCGSEKLAISLSHLSISRKNGSETKQKHLRNLNQFLYLLKYFVRLKKYISVIVAPFNTKINIFHTVQPPTHNDTFCGNKEKQDTERVYRL